MGLHDVSVPVSVPVPVLVPVGFLFLLVCVFGF